jgi:arsenate reductase-like glutaredoxin family protein
MSEKLKRVIKNMGVIFKNIGTSAGKTLENLDKADKELNEKMKKAMGSAEKY